MGSKLFDIAHKATRYAAQNRFAQTEAGRLQRAVDAYRAGKGSKHQVGRALGEFETVLNRRIVNRQRRAGVERYGVGQAVADLLRPAISRLGPAGRVLQGILDGAGTGSFTSRQLKTASDLLRSFGRETVTTDKKADDYERGIQAAIEALRRDGWTVDSTTDRITRGMAGRTEDERSDPTGSLERATARGAFRDDMHKMSKVYRTPRSSNVWSFQYDYSESRLYVRFKAPAINGGGVKNYKGKGGMTSMAGTLGGTVKGKTNDPGAMYAYHDVPVRVFRRLVSSIPTSAGKAVWDHLRVRGTVWGHKFKYTLVTGAFVPGEGGRVAVYVPRKAVEGGFRGRTVANVGRGRRGYANSTLPDTAPRSVNRGRPLPPSRGR